MSEIKKSEAQIKDERLIKEVQDEINGVEYNDTKDMGYEVTVELPSRGLLYKDDNIPAEITLRGMTTKEEKILAVSMNEDSFKKVIKACLVSPSDIDMNKMLNKDIDFLTIQLRMVTYGDSYKVSARCPICGKRNIYKVSLSEMPVNYLSEGFEEPIKITLPRSKDTISYRLLRNSDTDFIQKYSSKFAKQFNQDVNEVRYVNTMAQMIVAINDKEVDFTQARSYVDDMFSMDMAKLRTSSSKIFDSFGIDNVVTVTCPDCGESFDLRVPYNSDLFFPEVE